MRGHTHIMIAQHGSIGKKGTIIQIYSEESIPTNINTFLSLQLSVKGCLVPTWDANGKCCTSNMLMLLP